MSVQNQINRINNEVSEQTELIEQITTALAGKAAGGGGSGGVDTSDATATAGDILSGKTAYVDGEKITGTIATKTSSNLTVSGATVTVPAGYYASQATKSLPTTTQATPTITVSSDGLIRAKSYQVGGYLAATSTTSATKQLTTQAAKTVTPTTSSQTAVASGRYTTGAVTVAGDSNLVAANIKSGVSIFGVSGTYEGSGSGGGEAVIEHCQVTLINNSDETYDVYGTWYDESTNYVICYPTGVADGNTTQVTVTTPSIIVIGSSNVTSNNYYCDQHTCPGSTVVTIDSASSDGTITIS